MARLNVVLTRRCQLLCRHCFIGASPGSAETMPIATFLRAIDQANSAGVRVITLTGGEPLIYWESIKDILRQHPDIQWRVCTNGIWGGSLAQALDVCRQLRLSGVRRLEFSADSYHSVSVPTQWIVNGARAAIACDLDVVITVCFRNDVREEVPVLAVLSQDVTVLSKVRLQQTAPFGRGKRLAGPGASRPFEDLARIPCPHMGEITLTYDSRVYSCCGPCVTGLDIRPLFLGELGLMSVKEALDLTNSLRFCRSVRTGDWEAIVAQLPDESREQITRQQYTSLCEVCLELAGLYTLEGEMRGK